MHVVEQGSEKVLPPEQDGNSGAGVTVDCISVRGICQVVTRLGQAHPER